MPRSSTTFRSLAALGLPAAYVVLEFSFNHRLMTLTTDFVDEQVLQGLEFWGRLLSGIGFGLLLFRMTRTRLSLRQSTAGLLLRLALSLLLGVVLMWNLQKWITNQWVSTASEDDKRAAWVLGALASQAGQGRLTTLAGEPLLQAKPTGAEAQLTSALFPAASLYVDQREAQLAAWMATRAVPVAWSGSSGSGGPGPVALPATQLDNGFRNLIIPPLTLGFSLFFGLVNLVQLGVNVVPGMTEGVRRWAASSLLAVLVLVSATHASPFLDSSGYKRSMQANLWTGDHALALLTEWSFRSVALWHPMSEWLHSKVLQDFAFRKPY